MEALGSGVKGAITGATQAGLLASGAGLPTALFANALAGTAGSAAEQYIGGGRIDPEKSILGGLSNAVSNAIYGTDPLGSGKEAFLRGMGDGAANAALNYLFDTTGNKGVSGAGALPGIAGALFSPYEALRDPRRKCGSASPFIPIPGYGPAKGYQYEMPGVGSGNANTPKKFSICDFLLETVIGGITGGLSSAAFYGAGKGIERLMDGLRPGNLNEKVFERYTIDGKTYLDVENLPGETGIKIPRRLSPDEMSFLTKEYGVEFSLVYRRGTGKSGGGGQYWLYSGVENRVKVPIAKDAMLIYHTHPKGSEGASLGDRLVMKRLEAIGSPQRSSQIIPIGKDGTARFNSSGTYTTKW